MKTKKIEKMELNNGERRTNVKTARKREEKDSQTHKSVEQERME